MLKEYYNLRFFKQYTISKGCLSRFYFMKSRYLNMNSKKENFFCNFHNETCSALESLSVNTNYLITLCDSIEYLNLNQFMRRK